MMAAKSKSNVMNHSSTLSPNDWNGKAPPPPAEPLRVPFFRFIYRASRSNRAVDRFLTSFLKHRHYLPTVPAEAIIPNFATSEVVLRDLPRGLWATPLVDTLTVVKSAIGFKSKRILEIGSYKGSTALLIAENTSPDTLIWTLDKYPDHGEAYLGTKYESRITRIVGDATNELLDGHGPFDLIFVDADHDYESVFQHTIVAFRQLAPGGVILWHDYQQDDCLHGCCGVPEALHMAALTFQKEILSIEGTMLGIYSGVGNGKPESEASHDNLSEPNPWHDNRIHSI